MPGNSFGQAEGSFLLFGPQRFFRFLKTVVQMKEAVVQIAAVAGCFLEFFYNNRGKKHIFHPLSVTGEAAAGELPSNTEIQDAPAYGIHMIRVPGLFVFGGRLVYCLSYAGISLAATSLQIGFPIEENFSSYSVITFPSFIGLWWRSKVWDLISHPAWGMDSRE